MKSLLVLWIAGRRLSDRGLMRAMLSSNPQSAIYNPQSALTRTLKRSRARAARPVAFEQLPRLLGGVAERLLLFKHRREKVAPAPDALRHVLDAEVVRAYLLALDLRPFERR